MRLWRLVTGLALGVGALASGLALDGCNQQTVTATLRSLDGSSEVTFVCRGKDENGVPDQGLEIGDCPDTSLTTSRALLAVVTQTTTNELALVDVDHQVVVDVDPSVPGYTFLHLPSRPGDIVTTPGGAASFVGLTTPGKTGISAIPTTCLGPPNESDPNHRQAARDVTSFAACTLASTPGDMAVLVEPPAEDGTIRETCSSTAAEDEDPAAQHGRDCPANLPLEHGPPGRRKLVVALPEEGKLAVIDAQTLLNREPGSFDPCPIEYTFKLSTTPDASGQAEVLPADLGAVEAGTCSIARPKPPPVPPSTLSQPSSLAASSDGRLFVSDLGVPAVHVLDTSSVCKLKELPALLPMSFATPARVVTTSRVALSPLTPSGKQFVYAIDAGDQPASLMAFDVSPGSTVRTPIVREGSVRQPRETPDRISFAAPVQDVTFAFRDLPREDLTTGVAEVGVQCDPNPDAPTDPAAPGVQDRTTSDYTEGARPRLLRGLFGFAMLTSGAVVVIDVEDLDAPCRRPYTTNHDAFEDFRGCKGDTYPYDYLTYSADGTLPTGDPEGTKTVSDEVSCNMVEPHRPRAAAFGLSLPTLGLGAPSLRGLPQFTAPTTVTNVTAADRPKLLAVPFESPEGAAVDPEVYVGTTLYGTSTESTLLRVNPSNSSDQNSVTLPLVEPRSYATSDHNDLTYEGRVLAVNQPSGFINVDGPPSGPPLDPIDLGTLNDSTGLFCNNGVYDVDAMADYAKQMLGLSNDAAHDDAHCFAATHSDYVQVTGDFPSIIDSYWQSAAAPPGGRAYCENLFGEPARAGATELETARDLRIDKAFQDHLTLATSEDLLRNYCPRCLNTAGPVTGEPAPISPDCLPIPPAAPSIDDFKACFPGGIRYTVRGSNQWILSTGRPEVKNDVVADATAGYRCIRDCDPRKAFFHSRIFEIARTDVCSSDQTADACGDAGVGPLRSAEDPASAYLSVLDTGPCVYDPVVTAAVPANDVTGTPAVPVATRGVALTDDARACIFENLTSRFVVYRGRRPSVRDMKFTWDTTGGYYPLAASLAAVSATVMPQHIAYIPTYGAIAVVDAASLGLSLMNIDVLAVESPWPVY